MNKPIRIAFVGIGGVGGFYGGLLAHHYENNDQVEIIFIARGAHLKTIKANGLTVIHREKEIVARPTLATDDISKVGPIDFVILCTKSYDLKDTMQSLSTSLQPTTVVIPLLNGVNLGEKIQAIVPDILVLKGCTYIVSQINAPGIVENKGNIQTLYFGPESTLDLSTTKHLIHFEHLLKEAGIEAYFTEDIVRVVWEKFMLVSPAATASSAYHESFGELMKNHNQEMKELVSEVMEIAKKKKIPLAEDSVEKTMIKLANTSYNNTTSMFRDFQVNPRKTEIETLTTYLVEEGKKLGVNTPRYTALEKILKDNIAAFTKQ